MATMREGAQRRCQREKELARAYGPGQCLLGGAAGNRTRVLRHSLKTSPCAVRYVSTRISRSREPAEMTIPVAVNVPIRPATERIGVSL